MGRIRNRALGLLAGAKTEWGRFSVVDATTHASSISYYTFFSIVPTIAICISLITLLGINEQEVRGFLSKVVPDALGGLVSTLVADAFARSGLALSISTISLLWSASKGTKALRKGLNASYGEKENRSAPVVVGISIMAVLVLGVLIAAAMWVIFGNSALNALSQSISEVQPHKGVMEYVDVAVTLVAATIMLALFYTFLPAGKRRFAPQLPGAVCAIGACGVLSFGFRLYVDNFCSFTVLYGSIATVALLLFWMYLVFYILLTGAYINRRILELRASNVSRGRGTATAPERHQGQR